MRQLLLSLAAIWTGIWAHGGAAPDCPWMDAVILQLKWVPQAQFAGYYVARELGYYRDECLDVTLRSGGLDITPETEVAQGNAQFGITWQASMLESREHGVAVKSIAQVFQRSGMRLISWRDSQISRPEQLRGHTIGVWFGGHQYDLLKTLTKHGLDARRDVSIVPQTMDMNQLLQRQVDVAAAMTYNELAQVLETRNPVTGKLYQLNELSVLDFNDDGTAMLEDRIIAADDWLKVPKNHAIAVRFVRASLRGWIYCRDHPQAAVEMVLRAAPGAGAQHQAWQLNEVNKLIWPSPHGIGKMDLQRWRQTTEILQRYGSTKKGADPSAYTDQIVAEALAGLKELDVTGKSWRPTTVTLTEGGR